MPLDWDSYQPPPPRKKKTKKPGSSGRGNGTTVGLSVAFVALAFTVVVGPIALAIYLRFVA